MSVVKESPALYLWTITNKIKPQNDRPIWIETNNDRKWISSSWISRHFRQIFLWNVVAVRKKHKRA